MEWNTESVRLNVKESVQASLQFGRTKSSAFLCMKENRVSNNRLPERPISRDFHVELDEIDF